VDICVVDDNLAVTCAIQRLLVRSGLGDSKVYNDAAPALAWCQAHSPSLVLVDYQMPGMDGLEFLRALRADPRSAMAVVVVLTGWATESFRARALEVGANEVIAKPLEPIEFVRTLRALMGGEPWEAGTMASPPGERQVMGLLPAGLDFSVDDGDLAARGDSTPDVGVAHQLLLSIKEYMRIHPGWFCSDRGLVRRCMLAAARVRGLDSGACEYLDAALDLYTSLPARLDPSDPSRPSQQGLHARLAERAVRRVLPTHHPVSPDALQVCAQMVLFGQESWDGQGLPLGLRGATIPFAARLFNVVNSFSLLTLPRANGGAGAEISAAFLALEDQSGVNFDPALVAALRKIDPALLQAAS
jgi:response regulator RpfG family c-di-GMP phosphodiesterase